MSVETRPTDTITSNNLIIGVPYVEFAPSLSSGGYGPYRQLGIVNEARVTKTLELATLKSSHSGTSKLVRELVRDFEGRFVATIYNFVAENMQLFLASASLDTVNAGTTAVVNEAVTLQASDKDW